MFKYKIKSGIICLKPFYALEFCYNHVYPCICPDWIKSDIGDLKENTIAEIWNGDKARYIRRKMYRGKWKDICNPICPFIIEYRSSKKLILYSQLNQFDFLTPSLIEEIKEQKDYLESPPTLFNLANSNVCNLSCIMCSTRNIKDDQALITKTAKDIFNYLPHARRVILTGNGDPFARKDSRDLMINYKHKNPDLKFDIITNALLLPRYWEEVKHTNFGFILVSIDAATQKTYEKIRIGGNWDDLMRSLSLIEKNRDKFDYVNINMTVMKHNYKEIPDFIDMAECYGFCASFQQVRGTFNDQNIFEMKNSAALLELQKIIADEQLKKRNIPVFWGGLLGFTSEQL